ncbi:hypothetical protein G039_0333935 [Pseudomonas aeruginosa VRFPA01]|nr:hypothetical protein G039_0333935 [Pseudomonas aeruginosa VRFPA01]
MLGNPSGVVFAETNHAESWQAVARPEQRINLHIPELLPELARLAHSAPSHDPASPFILAAGERRSDTSNTAVRDTGWHRRGRYGTLRIQPHLGDDFLDAEVEPQPPPPAAPPARQQAGQRAGISEAFAVAVKLPLAGSELGGGSLHGRAVETTAGFQARDDVAPALGFGDLRLIHRRNVERRPWPG